MIYSDFSCPACNYRIRKWEMRFNARCPVFQCMLDNGSDVCAGSGVNIKIVRIGIEMTYLGTFREQTSQFAIPLVIP